MRIGETASLIIAVVSCGGGENSTPDASIKVCAPGQQIECACPAGAKGAQACKDDGSGYERCDCNTGSGGATSGDASDTSTGGASVDVTNVPDATAGDASGDIDASLDISVGVDTPNDSAWLDGSDTGVDCKNLQCFQNNCKLGECKAIRCPDGGTTSLSGVVYDPAGINPIYNVIVYVPNGTVEDIPTGVTCDSCGKVSGEPVTSTLTNAKGEFKLDNVPVTDNIPLVVQVGKWRRQVTIPTVANCADTRMSDRNQTRLPRDKSEGHLPRIAVATGGEDALECLLRKIGISESEMTPETGQGRLNFYAGRDGADKYNPSLNGGAAFTQAPTFWSNLASLKQYDIVLLSCEGYETSMQMNKSAAALQAMQDYTSVGGRVFASHWHNYWLEKGPAPFPTVALFEHHPDLPNPFTAAMDTTFPKGLALAEWMLAVGSGAPLGQLIITQGKHTVNRAIDGISQRWVYSASPVSTQYFTFNTPVGMPEDKQCGRVVFTDIHVSAQDTSKGTEFPDGCKTTILSDQEKALEFMLFDLSACLISDTRPPTPPK
jgi:hypothetical protein